MNFVKHEKDIKKLLATQGGKTYSGCYVYSRDEKDRTKKIGMSQAGLFSRIKSAKSCYPYKTEFWLEYIIISLDGHYKKGQTSNTVLIEKALHAESKHMSTVEMQKEIPEQGKRPREYRIVSTKTQMESLLAKTLNTHREKWDYVIIFSIGGWHIVANDRLMTTPIASINKLKPKKNANKTPTIYSLPLNKTTLVLPKNIKVGDIVEKSDNWGKFKVIEILSKTHIVATFPPSKKEYNITV